MSELEKQYDPSLVEKKWYAHWLEKGFFKADPASKKPPFSVIMPPPNVTGVLHMGHALVNTLQDILVRWKRMSGFEALWVPGTDHAGIATQTVVEKHLFAKTGKRRSDFTREEFLQHIWAWKEEHQNHILSQLKRLGCSCDWSRLRFTMDDGANKGVYAMFKKMYDAGLIYQGDYLVNWDPVLETAIADDEVEHEEQNSFLWHIRYPLENGEGHLIVATTRPETMLGDVAVAVSPEDARYTQLIGKFVILPLTNRRVPIIQDHFVDPTFGTGVVKITPAHDFNDYEVGTRHNLPLINILNPNGTLNAEGWEGLTVEKARVAIVEKLKQLGLLEKAVPHVHRVGVSYRTKAVVEPYLSKQWFVKMQPFKEKLIAAVRDEKVKLIPKHWEKTYYHWIENLRDWCISRQLWWGHRIPIWYNIHDPSKIICHIEEGHPKGEWRQDEAVLDTWFSSALWPLSTLGWPENTPELKTFYPTSTLITGHDILFFWVARMILMGEYATHKVPFHETFVHGLIFGKSYWRTNNDGGISYVSHTERLKYEMGEPVPKDVSFKWEKMSKSKGNVVDPIQLISQYGTDAMRFTLCSSVTHARQLDLDLRRFEEFKNFANKIWNAARFIFLNVSDLTSQDLGKNLDHALFTLDDKWILSRANRAIKVVNDKFHSYEFNEAAITAYEFFWDEFCAYYLETCKPYLFNKAGSPEVRVNKQKLLVLLLLNCVRLMHPIAPFITEEIFFQIQQRFEDLPENQTDPYIQDLVKALTAKGCIVAPFPSQIQAPSPDAEEQFSLHRDIVYALRNMRAEMQIPLGTEIEVYMEGATAIDNTLLQSLVRIKTIHLNKPAPKGPLASLFVQGIKIQIPLPLELQEKEYQRLTKELEKQKKQAESLQARLSNPDFLARAPKELVDQTESNLLTAKTQILSLENKLAQVHFT